jgi:hypothetical protein
MTTEADQYTEAWHEANKADTVPLGSGLVKNAADAIKDRAYQLHLKESRDMGETPMTPEQFAQGNKTVGAKK